MKTQNNLALLRRERGFSAIDLASRIGVTRQTVYAMEAGSYVPNTTIALRMARVLGVAVEDLFHLEGQEPVQRATEVDVLPGEENAGPGQPVQVCRVGDRLVATCPSPLSWILPPSDGVLVTSNSKRSKARATAQLQRDDRQIRQRLLLAGCDPGVSVLSRHLERAGVEIVAVGRNSSQSLDLLKQGLVHVAGTHLHAEPQSSGPATPSSSPDRPFAVFGFAVWEEGIVVAQGNPKAIQSVSDLARGDVSIVNREAGAGCRLLLDARLRELGIATRTVKGYDQCAAGHLPAAWHVLAGKADCCITTRVASRAFGLSFVPLLTKRYDLVIRKADLESSSIQTLIETLGRAAFRRELEALGGYDARRAGTLL